MVALGSGSGFGLGLGGQSSERRKPMVALRADTRAAPPAPGGSTSPGGLCGLGSRLGARVAMLSTTSHARQITPWTMSREKRSSRPST